MATVHTPPQEVQKPIHLITGQFDVQDALMFALKKDRLVLSELVLNGDRYSFSDGEESGWGFSLSFYRGESRDKNDWKGLACINCKVDFRVAESTAELHRNRKPRRLTIARNKSLFELTNPSIADIVSVVILGEESGKPPQLDSQGRIVLKNAKI